MRRGEMSIELIGLHWVVFRGIISTSGEDSGVVENEKRYLETLYILEATFLLRETSFHLKLSVRFHS
jgi:hypothetical protein